MIINIIKFSVVGFSCCLITTLASLVVGLFMYNYHYVINGILLYDSMSQLSFHNRYPETTVQSYINKDLEILWDLFWRSPTLQIVFPVHFNFF